MLPKQHKSITE